MDCFGSDAEDRVYDGGVVDEVDERVGLSDAQKDVLRVAMTNVWKGSNPDDFEVIFVADDGELRRRYLSAVLMELEWLVENDTVTKAVSGSVLEAFRATYPEVVAPGE